jgi:hypothetical protein
MAKIEAGKVDWRTGPWIRRPCCKRPPKSSWPAPWSTGNELLIASSPVSAPRDRGPCASAGPDQPGGNAVKFTHGGTVRWRVVSRDVGAGQPKQGGAGASKSRHAIGIARRPAAPVRVFEPGRLSTDRVYGGTGWA